MPTPEFFPNAYDASKKSVHKLLNRVCEYINVVPDLIEQKFVSNAGKIWLIKTHGHYIPIAHELAYVRLLGERWIMLKVFDNELLTDLTVVHFSMGIFLANTTRNWPSGNSKWPDTKFRKEERPD